MDFRLLNGSDDFFENAFYDSIDDEFDVEVLSVSDTRIEVRNPETGARTVLTGTNLPLDPENDLGNGTLTGLEFFSSQGALVASATDFAWPFARFVEGVEDEFSGDGSILNELLELQPVNVDATAASDGADFALGLVDTPFFFDGSSGDDIVVGGLGNDELAGGAGDDSLNPFDNNFGYDFIVPGTGDDIVDLRAAGNGYFQIWHGDLPGSIEAEIDGVADIGLIRKLPGGSTVIEGVQAAMQADGLKIDGTDSDDRFEVRLAEGGFLSLEGHGGDDRFDILPGGDGTLRLDYYNDDVRTGAVVDLSTGIVAQDGLGGRDVLTGLDQVRVQVRGTELADRFKGGDRDDYFIGLGGNDTIDGGAGRDFVRYDNTSAAGAITADLARGIVQGTWDGQAFTHSLISVEDIRGSRQDDTIRGDLGANYLLGGSGGSDYLYGDGVVAAYLGAAAGQVYRLYQATLDRAPDDQGYVNWSARLYEGERTLLEVIEGFVGSAEFQQLYGTLDDGGFVNQLYRNVLGRDADAQGLARWTGDLADGASRAEVVLGFSESPEFIANTAPAANRFAQENSQQAWSDDVFRLYQATLDRAPDQGGFEAWTGRLADDRSFLSVVEGFVGSPEFQRDFGGLDDGGFVNLLYQNVLGRSADAQGLARWTGELAGGASRAEVVLGFVNSPEFVAATTADLKDWMRGLDHGGRGYHDRLEAWTGEDVMAGGLFADVFEFDEGDRGEVRVLDLEAWDQVQFNFFDQFQTTADVLARFSQQGADTVFQEGDLRVVFQDTQRAEITEDMILI